MEAGSRVPGGRMLEVSGAPHTTDLIYFAGRRLGRYDNPEGTGAVYWLYDDADGNLRAIVESDGTVQREKDYTPFGQVIYLGGSGDEHFMFGGMFHDTYGDGSNTAVHRRENPTLNRWFSPDPGGTKVVKLSDPQTWNLYAYANNNPVTFNDPSGLCGSAVAKGQKPCFTIAHDYGKHLVIVQSTQATVHKEPNGKKVTVVTETQASYSTEKGHEGSFRGASQSVRTSADPFDPVQRGISEAHAGGAYIAVVAMCARW